MTTAHLGETTYGAVRNGTFRLAVLPWGATEAHNLHLPYGTDNIETEWIGREAVQRANAQGAGAMLLPVIPYGVNTGQLSIPWTINMMPSTQMAILKDVLFSLERQGIGRLVLLNGHGGNDFRQMIRELQPVHHVLMASVNWYRTVPLKDHFAHPGDHADEMETSVMLHIAPQLVRPLSEAGSGASRGLTLRGFREGWAWTPRDWQEASTDTGVGDPRAATAEKGKKYLEAVVGQITSFLVEFATTPPDRFYA